MSHRVTLTLPGVGNQSDKRVCVALDVPEVPWPLRFYFLGLADGGWANVGFEMGIGPVNAAAVETLPEDVVINPSRVRWLQENFFHYQAQAHSHLDLGKQARSKRGGRVSDELVALVASQYEDLGHGRGAITQLAEIHDVSRTTIWRWLKRAGRA